MISHLFHLALVRNIDNNNLDKVEEKKNTRVIVPYDRNSKIIFDRTIC